MTASNAHPHFKASLSALADAFNAWTEENHLPDDEPADALLIGHADELTKEQQKWLVKFINAWEAIENLY